MTAMVPGRPGMAAAERAGLEQALGRAVRRIDGLRRCAADVEDGLRRAGDPAADTLAVRELARRHTEVLGRLADAVAQRDALQRYLDGLDRSRRDGGSGRPDPSTAR